jgi:diguanylate cyclase (GGDEF)-like protein
MARTFGTLFVAGGLSGGLILAVGEKTDRNDFVIALLAAIAVLLGAICFVGYRKLPVRFFEALTAIGSVIIAGAVASASHGAEGIYALYYVWVVFLAFFFFSFRAGMAQAVFAALTYAVVLISRDAQFGLNLWISAVATLGTTGAMMGLMRSRVEQLAADSRSAAHTDALTGLANRRGFDQRFALEADRCARTGDPLSLIICDFDRFKQVNDELGHEAGDDALRAASAAIAASVRSIDAVSRLGGEEFAVLLPQAGEAEAFAVAERVRTGVLEEFSGHQVPLTASCGVATMISHGGDARQLFRAADSALYSAKRKGRNCTVSYDGEVDAEAASSTK